MATPIDNLFRQAAEGRDEEALHRLAELRCEALVVFGDLQKAADYLNRPSPLFEGERPIDAAANSTDGHQKAMRILGRISHGLGS